MSFSTAQKLAWNLATTLMTCIILFKTDDGYGVIPSAEFDGDPASAIHEYDPYNR